MNRIVSQIKATWGSSVILVAAILALFMTSAPGPLSLVAPVFGAGGVEVLSLAHSDPEQSRKAAALAYGQLPLSFEANQGQMESQVRFLSRGKDYKIFLTSTEAVLVLRQQARLPERGQAAGNRQQATGSEQQAPPEADQPPAEAGNTQRSALQTTVRMKLVGANPGPQIALEKPVGKVNYFIGNDPTKWRNNIPTYAKVHYRDVYPGVELVYYGQQGQLEYDFIVAPNADPSAIRLAFEGVDKIEIDNQGDLVLSNAGGEIRLRKPLIYQERDGDRQEISGGYVLLETRNSEPETRNPNPSTTLRTGPETRQVGFQVAPYDASRPLVIDPVLNYSTYLGGSGNDTGLGIAVDSAGNAYVTGSTDSTNFPTLSGVQGSQGGTDAFVAKLSPDGSALLYSTYLGGSGNDTGLGIAVDSAGNAYVTGSTDSINFPTNLAFQLDQGGTDAFVTKLSPDGSALLYSTYLGGSGNDTGLGIAVDSAGNAYVTGSTDSTNFPTSLALQLDQGGTDAFVTKLSSNGSALLYSTYLGGSGNDVGSGIAVDSAGNAYVAGSTNSSDFPMLNGIQGPQGGTDAFVTKLSSNGSALLYSTYLGGSGNDVGLAIAVIPSGRAYITGFTDSSNFPMKKAFQGYQGGTDAFVTRLNSTLSGLNSLLYSTYLGGSGNEAGHGIAVDSEGNSYVTGSTDSANFPVLNAVQGPQGGTDAFLTKVDPSVSGSGSVVYSTLLGGSGNDDGYGIALDAANNAYVTGMTESADFPVISGLAATLGGLLDTFVAKLAQPDLVNSAFSVPSTGGAGSTISANHTATNQGEAAAEASTTKFYLSTDTILDAGDVLLGSRAIPALASGESSAGSTELAIPAETAAGSYYLLAKVDADNNVAEAFEENNKSSRAIKVVHGPDLIVSALSTAVSGSTITVTDTTKNQGVIAASTSTTKFYLSTDATLDAGDLLLGSRVIAELAPGAVSAASTDVGIPPGTAAGSYYIIAKADADNIVSEVNEDNNNKASNAIAINPDLIVTTLSVPSAAGAGSTISVTDTTKNQAGVSASASTTKFFLSTDTTLSVGDVLLGSRAIPALAADAASTGTTALTIPAGTAAGKYHILVQADADSAVTERNEDNNTTASNAFTIGPDLIVSLLTTPSTVTPGSTISVVDVTINQGGGSASASTTSFFLSTDTNLDSTDLLLGSRAVSTLPPGTANSASTAIVIPAGLGGGIYYIIAKANADDAVVEADGNNNTASSTPINVGPDLIVSKLSVPPASAAGLTITVTDTTKNQGVISASASTTKFYLSSDTILDASDLLLGSRAIPALAPGEINSASTAVPLPPDLVGGTYYIIAGADGDNNVVEIEEGNNVTVSTGTILIGPDLIVWLDLPASSSTAAGGSTISINDTTKNDSPAPAGASTTKFYLSTDTAFDAGDILLGSRIVPALAPGASSSGSTLLTLPAGIGGTYYIIAQADADNGVAEANEGNNITATSSTIFIGPDLVVWLDLPASATSGTLSAGSTISVNDTTRNDSQSPAGASTTKFFLSSDTALDTGDMLLGSRAVPALAPGAISSGSTPLTLPTGIGGSYYIIAQADGDNAVAEANEGNNITATSSTIFIGPDLVVWLDLPASATSGTLSAGSTVSVNDTTRNDSQSPAGASTTKFFLSTDTNLDANDALLGSRAVPALAPGAISSGSTPLTLPTGIVGSYYIIAQADADNGVAEANEGNNISVGSRTILIGPDLILWFDYDYPAHAPYPGKAISVTDITKNESQSPAGPSTTRFLFSTDAALDAGDILLGSRAVAALAGGETSAAVTALTIPADTVPGWYYFIAVADANNAVAETNEGNNTVAKPIRVFPNTTSSDLVVWFDLPATVTSSTLNPGSTFSVTNTTKNEGTDPAAPSTTRFYLSTDTTLDAGDILIGSQAVPALDPGILSTATTMLTIPAGIGGSYYIIARADADSVVTESNENNNATVSSRTILIGPDLVVWLDLPASATSGTLSAGSTIFINDTAKNDSSVPAAPSTTKFYLSTDTSLDAGDILIGSRAVPALAPGALSSASTALALPAGIGGSYYIVAKADADNVVPESNEGNNVTVSSRTIFIGPDLLVWLDLPGAFSQVPVGSTILITDYTKNDSQSPAGASTTKFYLSSDTTLDASDIALGSRAVPALAPGALSSASTALALPAGIAGTYYIIAMADGDNALAESNEANNITASNPMAVGPDLVITGVSAPSKTGAGSKIYVSDTTKNRGGGAADATTTRFYLSTDTTLDLGDILLGSRAVPALAPSEYISGTTAVTIPTATLAGAYYIIAQADADNTVAEASEVNNLYAKVIEILPDLVISVLRAPSTAGPNSTITVKETTKNLGAGSTASITRFFLSADAILDAGDILLGSRAIPALALGETSVGSTSLTIPAEVVPDSYYIIAQADGDDAVAELVKGNNTRARAITITP